MSGRRLAAALAAPVAIGTLLLAGCEDAPRTTALRRVQDPWALVHGAGLVPVIVRGRPAAASADAVEDVVFRFVEAAVTWTATPPFVRGGAGDAAAAMRLVFVFNEGGEPCGGPAIGGEPRPDGEIVLLAVLCDGREMLARVDGRLGRSAGLDDRRFRRLVTQATRDLLAPPPAPQP